MRIPPCLFVCCLLLFPGALFAQQETTPAPRPSAQKAPAAKTPVREELEFTRWSGSVNIPDPVAISLDNQGRAYVTQTQRRKSQDLDIRGHRQWIPSDVGFRSVEDKRNFYHQELAIGNASNKSHVEDLNKDGVHDYRDLMVLSERIWLVEDADGNGTADRSQIYAEDFRTEVTGIAAGVLWHNGDVYATIAPDVWRMRDTTGDGKANQREIMATGFGLHIAYAGHDMHGLTVGPDGKIYWSVGDKGISVVSREGRRFAYPNQGGVMRCNSDGSDFEVFAHGLRNVQELAFNEYGDLFGVDNDSDQSGERERVVFIARGMDAGWRCNYQYRGKDYNPWMAEGLWERWSARQPAYITPPLAYSLNGPAGFTYNPGTALGPGYRNYFFLTGAPGGEQRAFQLLPRGATFEQANEHEIGSSVPLVGINFGPDGGLYGVDWGGGYPLNQKGAIWKIDVPGGADSTLRQETRELLAAGFAHRETNQLQELLSHADQRVRLGAQFELVQRQAATTLQQVAQKADADLLARIHAIWGVGQLIRQDRSSPQLELVALLAQLLQDPQSEIRAQAARTISDLPHFEGQLLTPLLADAEPRVRFQAGLALARHATPSAVPALVKLAESLQPSDNYLRLAAAQGLAGSASTAELADLSRHAAPLVRTIAVLALRQQDDQAGGNPAAAAALGRFVSDENVQPATEAALALYEGLDRRDLTDDAALLGAAELAAVLPATPQSGEAFVRRAISAAYLLGDVKSADRVAAYAQRTDVPIALRLDALDALRQWPQPPLLDRVDGRRRRLAEKRQRIHSPAVKAALIDLLASTDAKLQAAALKTSRDLGMQFTDKDLVELAQLVAAPKAAVELRLEALDTLRSQKYSRLAEVITGALQSTAPVLRMRALELLKSDPAAALAAIEQVLARSKDLRERQHAVLMLGDLATARADAVLAAQFQEMAGQPAPAATALELMESVSARAEQNVDLARLLTEYNDQRASASDDPIALWTQCLTGGDATEGKETFMNHITTQCIRCHQVGKTGSTVGPNLESIALQRDGAHLLRSIVAPSADIEPKYQSQTLLLLSGRVVQGLLLRKDDKVTVLADNQGKEVVVPNDQIDESLARKISIMPEIAKVLTPREIRNLVAYLQTLKKPLPAETAQPASK
ncbi:PVC-type heme-binding CxxCH protein [Lignipirellula cremea]|uniref:Cytochrome c n=1 Tax=Lignipirellula cremea TaxID=2528010 RepID=A0A518DLF6_9BACT|nr:PVC-type heme-binding CxxCH protein [Lignipirellula cremea]QDU92669.1 Cytochrome c [Lignipirellula cremea]